MYGSFSVPIRLNQWPGLFQAASPLLDASNALQNLELGCFRGRRRPNGQRP